MRHQSPLIAIAALSACTSPSAGPEPSLAPRPAEAIDPRIPIPGDIPAGPADAALLRELDALVAKARAGVGPFQSLEATASRLAASAGPVSSEGWVSAQQALSRLIEQYGVTTRAAADIDALAAQRLRDQRWIGAADQHAITSASAEVGAIDESQSAAIARIREQLSR
jgi:hypothetical protein